MAGTGPCRLQGNLHAHGPDTRQIQVSLHGFNIHVWLKMISFLILSKLNIIQETNLKMETPELWLHTSWYLD